MSRTRAPKKRQRLKGPIHARLAELREAKELTQEEVAAAVGVDKTAVSHWENGIARPDISRLPALADTLGVSIDELLDGTKAA